MRLWLTALIGLACAAPARADVVYDSGTTNNLSAALADNVLVRDAAAGGPTSLNVLTGGSVYNASVSGGSAFNLAGGTARRIDSYGSSTVTLLPAGFLLVTAQTLVAHDTSTMIISPHSEGSTTPLYLNSLTALDASTVTANGAEVGNVSTYGTSHLTVNVLNIHGSLSAYDESVVDLNDPGFSGLGFSINALGNSTINLRDNYSFPGQLYVTTDDTGTLNLFGAFDHAGGLVTDRTGVISGTFNDGTHVVIHFTRNGDSRIIINTVPEPAGLTLAGLGALTLAACARRRLFFRSQPRT